MRTIIENFLRIFPKDYKRNNRDFLKIFLKDFKDISLDFWRIISKAVKDNDRGYFEDFPPGLEEQ